jgi:hypothetical protein
MRSSLLIANQMSTSLNLMRKLRHWMNCNASPMTRAQRSLVVAHFQRTAKLFVERAERNPWTHELRAVLAEADRTGDRKPRERTSGDPKRVLRGGGALSQSGAGETN